MPEKFKERHLTKGLLQLEAVAELILVLLTPKRVENPPLSIRCE